MPSIANFNEVEAIFQRALDAPSGNTQIECASHGDAINLRQRLNNWRFKNRKDNAKTYPSDHPLWGASPYDPLSMRVPPPSAPDSHCIYITRRIKNFKIKELPVNQSKIDNECEYFFEQASAMLDGRSPKRELDGRDFPELWRTQNIPQMFCTICGKDFDTAGRRPRFMCDACLATEREGDDTK